MDKSLALLLFRIMWAILSDIIEHGPAMLIDSLEGEDIILLLLLFCFISFGRRTLMPKTKPCFKQSLNIWRKKKKKKKPSHELVIQHFISPISRQATEPDKPLFKETPCNIYSKMRKKVFSLSTKIRFSMENPYWLNYFQD